MSPRSLLLVDDDVDIRETLAEALQAEGWTVVKAANGREALQHLRGGSPPPAAIILDLLMPVMNGWQFCDEKAADPALAPIPVIAVSSAASTDRASPYFIDVAACVPKPVSLEVLLEKIHTVTGSKATPPPAKSAPVTAAER